MRDGERLLIQGLKEFKGKKGFCFSPISWTPQLFSLLFNEQWGNRKRSREKRKVKKESYKPQVKWRVIECEECFFDY